MNRRSFLSVIASIAAAPTAVSAASGEPQAPAQEQCSICSGWFPRPVELHHSNQECATHRLTTAMNEIHRQQSAGPSFIGMMLEQLVEAIKGDHPFALRHAQQSNGNARIEFDVMASCNFAPPSWLNLGPGCPSYVFAGDILSFHVRVGPPFGPAALIQSSPL